MDCPENFLRHVRRITGLLPEWSEPVVNLRSVDLGQMDTL